MTDDIFLRLEKVRRASGLLTQLNDRKLSEVLQRLADAVLHSAQEILSANSQDLARMAQDDPRYDRLRLTQARVEGIAEGIRAVSELPSPLGRILSETIRPNGLRIERVSTAFGVIGIIFEARPNVSLDVFSICLKSGNACVLKGGHDASCTNRKIVSLIKDVLRDSGLDPYTVELFETSHEETRKLLEATEHIDLIIPRGSSRLIQAVRQMAKVPVIETGAGIVHTYLDEDADPVKASRIILNAKTRRVSVCNALDCLIVHQRWLDELPDLLREMAVHGVVLEADDKAYGALRGAYPDDLLREATPESFGTEFLDYRMAIRTVADMDSALEHIARYSSRHSECIITENAQNAGRFLREVDAACLYHNAPTSFSDGGEFGLGAEIGISTQKLHARGPMGLEALTTYKWVIRGDGQIRS